MPPRRKLSGSELLAELGAGALDRTPTPPAPPRAATAAPTGRPPKISGKGVSLTVRVSEDQAAKLRQAAIARSQSKGGAIATAQDIIRLVVDQALADPIFPRNIEDLP